MGPLGISFEGVPIFWHRHRPGGGDRTGRDGRVRIGWQGRLQLDRRPAQLEPDAELERAERHHVTHLQCILEIKFPLSFTPACAPRSQINTEPLSKITPQCNGSTVDDAGRHRNRPRCRSHSCFWWRRKSEAALKLGGVGALQGNGVVLEHRFNATRLAGDGFRCGQRLVDPFLSFASSSARSCKFSA